MLEFFGVNNLVCPDFLKVNKLNIMSNNNLILSESSKGELNVESIQALIKAGIVPKDTPMSQVQIFAHVCKEKGISPFSKEIYLLAYADKKSNAIKYSIITGIDGFRKIAARTGQLAGCDDAKYDLKADGTYKTIADYRQGEMPNTCTITVYRLISGTRCPFSHTAKFSEFTSGQQKWATMPFQMIAKVAESFAIRKGFADATSGISIEEESVAISDAQIIDIKTKSQEQIQKEIDAEILSEQWLDAFKEEVEQKGISYAETRSAANDITQRKEYKLLVSAHIEDYKNFVLEKLSNFQNA